MILDEREQVGKPNRVAACMILGDSYDRDELIACVNSLKIAGVDKLFIAYNGKTRRSLQWWFAHMKKIGLYFCIKKFVWEDDFALARQQSFDLVPKDEFEWMMWIDSDDILVVEKPLNEMFESLDKYTQGVFIRYDYASDPVTGAVAVVQWRERFLSTKATWQWIYPVHEVVFSPAGTQFAKRDHVHIKHMRTEGESRGARERNRRIISKALRETPDHPRLQFYFANEMMAEADSAGPEEKERTAKAAILAFKRFLSNEQASPDDLYLAATRVGELYLMAGDPNAAVDAFLSSLKIMPDWPDAYIGVARAAMELQDWTRCKAFCDIALKMTKPVTNSAVTPLTYEYTPYLVRGIANEGLGNLTQALEDFTTARAIWNPPSGMLDDRIKEVEQKIAVMPMDKDERKRLRGTRPEKSIAFMTAPIIDPWHPELEKKHGAGGAETCIMRLAPRFAADGWRVVVFGTPSPEHRGVYQNVEYWDSQEFLAQEEFSVLISSRLPEAFESEVAAKTKILWMHDVNVGPRLYPFIGRMDTIVGLTNWHVNHMSKLYGVDPSNFSVIPNGIELDLYDWESRIEETNGELRFIWSSSPDRGLDTLIALWPAIKSVYPDSRLDIFYGWNIIDKLIERKGSGFGYLAKLKRDIITNIFTLGGEEAGIYQHGRVPQSELAQWQLKAHIWPYPTDFMETFCITAIESQAAGVIPVASRLAALTETVANNELLIEGWPRNFDYQKRFLKTLEYVVEGTPEYQSELQLTGRKYAEQFSWDESYSKWNDLFRRLNGR
jgi:glycosyltransferase involved in cell wall biosynthesis